ncbi:MAG: hypothetical protein OXE84_09545 [Rhodobacteraceae bacterium]|nr:hypothetical protein [Paracoccaceae bacterium]MCY4197910.1 hypothetical protein [Paracoccaceae bacterium]MCY4326106.1 hypothetical protein [Paracoccaceae bacterium]
MQPRALIASARRLLGRGRKGKPRQSDLKRAMSTAYYAMFHALCRNCADSFIGTNRASRSLRAWRQVYRSVDHGYAKAQCMNQRVMRLFPSDIKRFAVKLRELQEQRLLTDYDPLSTFTRADVQTAIKGLHNSNIRDRKAFAAWTVMKKR